MSDHWVLKLKHTHKASYRNLKLFIGILGMALPLILVVGGLAYPDHSVQPSISNYYHTHLQDVLVAVLATASVLFMSYVGYSWVDDLLTWLVGIAGIGVILFPCPMNPQTAAPVGVFQLPQGTSGNVHYASAALFFVLLAVNAIFLFTATDQPRMGPAKRARNVVYDVCGGLILACVAALGIARLSHVSLENSYLTLILEWVMLWAFGVSWLVKADIGILPDAMDARRAAAPPPPAKAAKAAKAARPAKKAAKKAPAKRGRR